MVNKKAYKLIWWY